MTERLPLRERALTTLRLPGAPRVFSPAELRAWSQSQGVALPERSQTQALIEWASNGAVQRVNNQSYLNLLVQPRAVPDEAAAHLRSGAVVSLSRVLGQAGVLNNPTSWITAVVSIERTRKVGEIITPAGTYAFAALPAQFFPDPASALGADAYEPCAPYMLATPEKAFLDGLYLQSTPRGASRWERPIDGDWDLDMLDRARLDRLAEGLGLTALLAEALSPAPQRRAGMRP